MTLQEIANIGEILGATGVIASLIFVGWQIRSNTRTTRMRMHEQVTHTFLSFLNSVLLDPDAFSAGLQSTDKNFADLEDRAHSDVLSPARSKDVVESAKGHLHSRVS
jgi:hypothetical protein